MTLCGFAYPLFSILERESLSVPSPPPLLLLSTRDSYHRCSSSFAFPSSFHPLAQFFGVLPSTQSSWPNELASRRPLRFHLSLCSLLRCSLSIYLCSSAVALSAAQRPSVAYTKPTGFYYEIRDSPGLVQVYPYLPTPLPFRLLSGHNTVAIYIGKLCECRIMPDYASPAISSFLTSLPCRGNPHIEKEIYIPITFHVFIAMKV